MDASELKHENFGKGWVGRPTFSNSKHATHCLVLVQAINYWHHYTPNVRMLVSTSSIADSIHP